MNTNENARSILFDWTKESRMEAMEYTELTALDILFCNDSDDRKLWNVLSNQYLDSNTLHEFACRCAEKELLRVAEPDLRAIVAITAKRAWLRREITDEQLEAAHIAALIAVIESTEYSYGIRENYLAYYASSLDGCIAARATSHYAAKSIMYCHNSELRWQVTELKKMLIEAKQF